MPSDVVRFLLVDDLDENLRALEALLRCDGLEIHLARSGMEALELLLRNDYALALLDVQMPGMDGFELAELMRGTERTRQVPIIFVTAAAADEGRRFRGYEAGAVDYVFKPVDPLVMKSKAKVFFEIGRQHLELARRKDELQTLAGKLGTALDRLQAHSDNSPLAIVEFDPDLRVLGWSKGAERMFGWTSGEMVGHRLTDLGWVPDVCTEDLRSQFFADAQPARGHEDVRCRRKDGASVESEWYASLLRDGAGRPLSLNVQILDVTDRRRAEETQRLLIGELNHRVKNTLATVQAIATQTLRHTRNPDHFADTFSGRIQSLASAHSLLSDSTWQGAGLADLVRDQLRHGTVDPARLSASGPEISLAPQAALRLGLVLHELATNACKYGAFSGPDGRVALTWSVDDGRLVLIWEEAGGPPVRAPSRRGFGSTLIDGSIRSDGGTAAVSYRVEGVVWRIELPLGGTKASEIETRLRADEKLRAVQAKEEPVGEIADKTYLVVEDEALVALELVSILEDAGATAIGPAGTVADALAAIETERFDAPSSTATCTAMPWTRLRRR
ncbi:HWE histidine kinase domain-containing protein [Methylobrevis pamukkalensis]|uniref:Blue-light-activated histidine kinase n=1 Tax=Methylobrevis pamukkalensis TaxID=1439726 RepID=A0A1E3H6F9_9HYPH|nr:HWE histidine kinase domain-containing protein [Methylobrevis pamukkalensis]ODN71902.1 Blue-light-activated histidine kinase 1 [Methylobrevis pamukkalensis]